MQWEWQGRDYPDKYAMVYYLRKDSVLVAKLYKLGSEPWQISVHTKRYAAEARHECVQKLVQLARERIGV
jgi:hypothetical protein